MDFVLPSCVGEMVGSITAFFQAKSEESRHATELLKDCREMVGPMVSISRAIGDAIDEIPEEERQLIVKTLGKNLLKELKQTMKLEGPHSPNDNPALEIQRALDKARIELGANYTRVALLNRIGQKMFDEARNLEILIVHPDACSPIKYRRVQ